MSAKNEEISVEFGDYWVYISNSSFHFSGNYTRSENGKYILAWKDNLLVKAEDDENDEGGEDIEELDDEEEELYAKYLEREFKEGFILLEDQKLILLTVA